MPAFLLASGPSVQVARRIRTPGLGQGVFGVDRKIRFRLFAAMEFHRAENVWAGSQS